MKRSLFKSLFSLGLCMLLGFAHADSTDPFSLKKSSGLSLFPTASSTARAAGGEQQAPAALGPLSPKQVSPSVPPVAVPSSEVFGSNLFTGAFAKQAPARFNPDYAIMIGDRIQLRIWGGFDFDGVVEVDPKGNVFLPHVGPVAVLGVANDDLQKVVERAAQKVFRANVFIYASLAAAQPVRVFVGGFVARPGLYNGTSMDSLLSYLDQAGGIDPDRGSFLNVQVKRGDRIRASLSLYDFLVNGRLPLVQLADGDVIFVSPRQSTVGASGLVANAKRFEFAGGTIPLSEIVALAKPNPYATHVRVARNTGERTNTEYYPIEQAGQVTLNNGDTVEFTADKKLGTITVRVEGEHQSAQEYVLPYGTRLGALMEKIQFSERSDSSKPKLFRNSVKDRQKQLLMLSLKSLESSVLTARSGTSSEASLRTDEANLILQWVDRAKQIEPLGQVVIAKSEQKDQLLLENGDVIKIYPKDGLVLIAGEILFPSAIAYDKRYVLSDYIKLAGGFSQNADTSKIVVAHRDGSIDEGSEVSVVAGDEILVLPKIDVKSREITKDVMQVIYQLAIAAKVVFGL